MVNRWRAQTFNPDSAAYSVESAPAVQVPVQPQPSIRRDPTQPVGATLRPGIQPAPQGFGQHAPHRNCAAVPTAPRQPRPASPVAAQQGSLASLIKQFRT